MDGILRRKIDMRGCTIEDDSGLVWTMVSSRSSLSFESGSAAASGLESKASSMRFFASSTFLSTSLCLSL